MGYCGFDTFEEWQAWWDKELSKPPKDIELFLSPKAQYELEEALKREINNSKTT